jgi:hypothetical protein
MTPKYRITAGLIGLIGLAALGTQLGLRLGRGQSLGAAIWAMAGFFTILTNVLMAATMLVIAVTGRRLPFGWMSMITLSMGMVGLVYHTVLAQNFAFSGLRWWADHGLHSLLPALMLWFWLMETSRANPRGGQPLLWLLWPLGYGIYALVRGGLGGRYPYPFLNIEALGLAAVALNGGVLLAGFVGFAYALNALGQRMPLRVDA